MEDTKVPAMLHTREDSLSDDVISEKHAAVLHGAVHAENLEELYDPDAGKSPEERAAIDKKLMRRVDLWLIPWYVGVGEGSLAYPDFMLTGSL
jgi:hypothetical protein